MASFDGDSYYSSLNKCHVQTFHSSMYVSHNDEGRVLDREKPCRVCNKKRYLMHIDGSICSLIRMWLIHYDHFNPQPRHNVGNTHDQMTKRTEFVTMRLDFF